MTCISRPAFCTSKSGPEYLLVVAEGPATTHLGDPQGRVLITRAPGYRLRVDPGDLDAERFVLGSILMDDSQFVQVAGTLEGDDFRSRGAARLRSLGSGFRVVDLTGEGDHWYLEPEPVLPGEPPTDSH